MPDLIIEMGAEYVSFTWGTPFGISHIYGIQRWMGDGGRGMDDFTGERGPREPTTERTYYISYTTVSEYLDVAAAWRICYDVVS